jgi:sulfur carrier protein ThiS
MSRGSVDVYLYGALQTRFGAPSPYRPVRAQIEIDSTGTIQDVLAAMGLSPKEVSHLFLNGQYSAASRRVKAGDRLAVFGRDMALLYRQYFPKVADPA